MEVAKACIPPSQYMIIGHNASMTSIMWKPVTNVHLEPFMQLGLDVFGCHRAIVVDS